MGLLFVIEQPLVYTVGHTFLGEYSESHWRERKIAMYSKIQPVNTKLNDQNGVMCVNSNNNVVIEKIISCFENLGIIVSERIDHDNFSLIDAKWIFPDFTIKISLTHLMKKGDVLFTTVFYDNYNKTNEPQIYNLINSFNHIIMGSSCFIYDPDKKVIFTRNRIYSCHKDPDTKILITSLKKLIFDQVEYYKIFIKVVCEGFSVEEVSDRYFSEDKDFLNSIK
jgi:hypothetical protein